MLNLKKRKSENLAIRKQEIQILINTNFLEWYLNIQKRFESNLWMIQIFEVGKKFFVEKYFFFAFYERLSFFDGKYGYFSTFDQQISA